jgi:chromosomal replication initiator protein
MQAWDDFLQLLNTRFGSHTVDRWVRSLKISRFDACNLYLEGIDSFQVSWFREHVLPIAEKELKNNNGHAIKLHLSSPDLEKQDKEDTSLPFSDSPQSIQFEPDPIIPHCTFEQYIPMHGNKLPFQVFCKLIGFNPETATYENPPEDKFNPIYLYGPSGVGKTHLLMAAAMFFQLSGQKVFYAKAETFTNHVVNAIRKSRMQKFRETYRNIDVLIIDDVQVLGRKSATQEELFHTFNTLHTAGKQIILSSHVNPRLLEYVEERLISRFEWGITLPFEKGIESTDLEKILKSRSSFYGIQLKKSVAEFLLKNFTTPATLSRALFSMQMQSSNSKANLQELGQVEPILNRLIEKGVEENLTPEKILSAVVESFGIKKEDILGTSQSRDTTLPRQIAMYLLRRELKLPYMKIGDIFHRDHSTVMSAINQVKKSLQNPDSEIHYYLNQLRSFLSSYNH